MELTKINVFVNRAMSFMMPSLMFVMNGVKYSHNMGRRTFDRITGSYDRGYAGIFTVCYAGDNVVSVYNYDVYNDTKSCRLCKRIGQVLDVEPTIEDSQNKSLENHKGVVQFSNVSFAYPDAEEKTLENISFLLHNRGRPRL